MVFIAAAYLMNFLLLRSLSITIASVYLFIYLPVYKELCFIALSDQHRQLDKR